MEYKDLIQGMKKFGSTENDICLHGLSVIPERIQENVIIAPWWEPSVLPNLGVAEMLSPPNYAIGVWNIVNDETKITYIRTGIGAPMFLEGLLPLGLTNCKKIIFYRFCWFTRPQHRYWRYSNSKIFSLWGWY